MQVLCISLSFICVATVCRSWGVYIMPCFTYRRMYYDVIGRLVVICGRKEIEFISNILVD